jgi:hypothetical protein
MINIQFKSKTIFAVTMILALFLCIGLVSASTDIDTTSNSNDVNVVGTNYINDNVAESLDSADADNNDQTNANDENDFTSLNQTINTGGETITLDRDYKFNNATDSAFVTLGGIVISKDLTIDGAGHTIDCDNQVRFLLSDGYTLTLKNINIQNGFAPKQSDVSKSCGGAVFIQNANGNFENVTFYDNYAYNRGGAVAIVNGNGIFNGEAGCTFSGNTASYGGAVDIMNGNGNFTGGSFGQNVALDYAGAVRISNGTGIFDQVFFDRNVCNETGIGGALYFSNGATATITNSKFEGNKAKRGGAVYVYGSNLSPEINFNNVEFEENFGEAAGGAVVIVAAKANFKDSTFTNNSGNYVGGAVDIDSGIVSFDNVTFDGNYINNVSPFRNTTSQTMAIGGAIYIFGTNSVVTVKSSDFKNNKANLNDGYGGAIALLDGSLDVTDSYFDGNDVGNIVITNGAITESNNTATGELIMYYANMTAAIEDTVYGHVKLICNVTCMDPDVVVNGRIMVMSNGTLIGEGIVKNGTGSVYISAKPGTIKDIVVTFTGVPRFVYLKKAIGDLTITKNEENLTFIANNVTSTEEPNILISSVEGKTIDYGHAVVELSNGMKFDAYLNDGVMTFPFSLTSGAYSGNLTLDADCFTNNFANFSFEVLARETKIELPAKTFTLNYDGTYSFAIYGVLTNSTIDLTIGNIKKSVVTDEYGRANVKFTAAELKSLGAGKKTIAANYAGGKGLAPSKATNTITINKEATKFANVKTAASAYKSTAKSMKLTATLKDSKNKVMKNQVVTFKVNNKKSFSVKTNAKGVATLTLNAAKIKQCKLNKKGNYKFTVTYKASATYNKATGNGKIKVTK